MRFGEVPVEKAVGALAGHAVRAGRRRFAKGHAFTDDDVATLRDAGIQTVVAARLDAHDVHEDEAAYRLASIVGSAVEAARPGTGRCNLHAAVAGLFNADRDVVNAVNAVDPGITLATLPDATPVERGRMTATVKIIPFAVPREALERAEAIVTERSACAVQAWRPLRYAMVSTLLPSLKSSVLDKTERITRDRLTAVDGTLVSHERTPHEVGALAAALRASDADVILVFGASAVTDASDVIPAAIRAAGGRVERFGMPVDPGNLLVIGDIGGRPVIGAPGCARAPAENGFDWALHRVAAGLPVTDEWLRSLGVGGLLMEIHSRPQPREGVAREAKNELAVVVLAAGASRRMGEENKLTRPVDGTPLVARAVDAALAADIGAIHVVTGHEADAVGKALVGRDASFVHNPNFADGMSTSLATGIAAVEGAGGAMLVLGDMPDVTADGLRALAVAFREHGGERVVAARDPATGRRGNPVVWPRAMFADLVAIEGDRGARDLLMASDPVLVDVEGSSLDLDTPEAFVVREAG